MVLMKLKDHFIDSLKSQGSSRSFLIFLVAVLVGLFFCGSCSSASPEFSLPPEYTECIEISPVRLVDIYMNIRTFGDERSNVEYLFQDKMIVLKDINVDEDVIRELENGWIWVRLIQCVLVDVEEMKRFEVGDQVDVIGINQGFNTTGPVGLLFADCVVIPSGSVELATTVIADNIFIN